MDVRVVVSLQKKLRIFERVWPIPSQIKGGFVIKPRRAK